MLSDVCGTSTCDMKHKNIYKNEIFVNASKVENLASLVSKGAFVNHWTQFIISGEFFSWGQV
jgi:hypothetical protein